MRNIVALILGGGRGTRLAPLTSIRAKPAVPLAGKYRLIDIPISNCINSEINKIYVLTQFLSVSLHSHIRRTYSFDQYSGGFVELLAAQETGSNDSDWYQGTADAVRKNLRYIEQEGVDYVVILSGDQLYRMDYREMLETHIRNNADVTIAGRPVSREAARGFGIMRIDATGRVIGFLEKPKTEAEIQMVRMEPQWLEEQGIRAQGRDCLASMGIYIFNRQTLLDVLTKTDYADFGKEVFPAAIRSRKVQVHVFDDYWEDIGTIRSFFEANLELCRPDSPFDLVAPNTPVYSRARYLPPTMIRDATVRGSLIADGCQIGTGTVIENSIIGLRAVIGKNVTIRNSIIMGADFYSGSIKAGVEHDRVPLGIGDGSTIQGTIVDKNCRIGRDVTIDVPADTPDTDLEHPQYVVRDGVVIVVKDAVIPDQWQLTPETLPKTT
jgi:glucose-1-phosphate adenylyltransferase